MFRRTLTICEADEHGDNQGRVIDTGATTKTMQSCDYQRDSAALGA